MTKTRRMNQSETQLLPVLLSQPQAWAFVGLSRSGWFALRSSGQLPDPVYPTTSSRPYWRREELEVWASTLPTSRRESVERK